LLALKEKLVDLRKLHILTEFDPHIRYQNLLRFSENEGFSDNQWLRKVIGKNKIQSCSVGK